MLLGAEEEPHPSRSGHPPPLETANGEGARAEGADLRRRRGAVFQLECLYLNLLNVHIGMFSNEKNILKH